MRRIVYAKVSTFARSMATLKPSTINTGFILSLPKLENPFSSDPAYQRVLAWYLPKQEFEALKPQLTRFGDEAISSQINEWIANAEQQPPYVKTRDLWGNRYPADRLITSLGWKELGKWGAKNGVISLGYEEEFGSYRRIAQHAFNFIYSASSAVYSCPVSMTSGAARLMSHQMKDLPAEHPFHEIYKRLTARTDNWISSQWMTERPGGSDVQNSETVAVYSPLSKKSNDTGTFEEGDYLVSGYKFFCSATDCDICFLLAKTESGQLSLFVAPTKLEKVDENGNKQLVTNGIRFHRLKNKMGTKELPTAELELKDVRAWRVGPTDRGIATIALLLNVTRTHNFITALSCWRRGMAIAKSFARARTTINQPLWTFPMHLRLLSAMEVKFQGLLQLAFFTTALLSYADNGFPKDHAANYAPLPSPGEQTKVVLRTFTATAKAVICKVACMSLQECQEAMGGVGYMDEPDEPEFNISRLYRDTAANMTWEGTTNVLSSEVVRHLLKGDNLEIFDQWLGSAINSVQDSDLREPLTESWSTLHRIMNDRRTDIAFALADGRQLMFSLAWIVSGTLLAHDAQRDGNPVAIQIAKRWILDGEGGVGEHVLPEVIYRTNRKRIMSDRDRRNLDCNLVWGVDLPEDAALGYRSERLVSSL